MPKRSIARVHCLRYVFLSKAHRLFLFLDQQTFVAKVSSTSGGGQVKPYPLRKAFGERANADAVDILSKLLVYAPSKRTKAPEVLFVSCEGRPGATTSIIDCCRLFASYLSLRQFRISMETPFGSDTRVW